MEQSESTSADKKKLTQQRFGQYAAGYVTSQPHAKGAELDRLLELAKPQSDWLVMDMATGGGHTALKFAPHVRKVVAADLTPLMLNAARGFMDENNVSNMQYTATDAEHIAFADGVFDLVTCRIAPHHFPDVFRFVQECARVLKPGGYFLVQDQAVPEDDKAARYIDSFERLRDPSHNRIYAEYEWRGMYLDAGLEVDHAEIIYRSAGLLTTWAERQGCDPETIEKLQVMLAQAPQAVADFMLPQYMGTPQATFNHNYIVILGHKPIS